MQVQTNLVASNANGNNEYIKFCKQFDTDQQCATGPGNKGYFLSSLADQINGQ